jgi:hypothetical protein
MIKIEFEHLSWEIPDSWKDIPLADYEKWYLQKPATTHEYIAFVADVCKIDAGQLLELPAQVFEAIAGAIGFVFDNEPEPSNRVNIGGKDYFVSFADKLTLGEWVDIEGVLESDSPHKLSEILAILCRPAGEKYDPDNADKHLDMFRNLPCDKALQLVSFFLLKKKRSEEISNHYLTVIAQANRFLRDTETFAINGGGIKLLPIWQRIRYICLVRSLKKQLSKFSDFSSTV